MRDAILNRLNEIAAFEKGWDDEGSDPIPADIIESVRELITEAELPPNEISPSPNKELIVGWRNGDECTEWEISEPYVAEVMVIIPGVPIKHFTHRWKVEP